MHNKVRFERTASASAVIRSSAGHGCRSAAQSRAPRLSFFNAAASASFQGCRYTGRVCRVRNSSRSGNSCSGFFGYKSQISKSHISPVLPPN